MKVMRKLVMVAACAALAVFLGAQSASASCWDAWGGRDGANSAECYLASSTETTCTYTCTCYGDCSRIYSLFGARKISPAS